MSSIDLAVLAERVEQLSDRQEIGELVMRLGVMLDEHRFDDALSILAEDVTVQTTGGSARGPEAVVAQARRNHTVRTQHVITDALIDLGGDQAEVRANLIVTFAADQPGSRLVIGDVERPDSHLTLGEIYRFQAVRTAEGWRLAGIEVERLWSSLPLTGPALVGQTNRAGAPAAS